jgi:hypothetical protein
MRGRLRVTNLYFQNCYYCSQYCCLLGEGIVICEMVRGGWAWAGRVLCICEGGLIAGHHCCRSIPIEPCSKRCRMYRLTTLHRQAYALSLFLCILTNFVQFHERKLQGSASTTLSVSYFGTFRMRISKVLLECSF